jgi:hypothetical protein
MPPARKRQLLIAACALGATYLLWLSLTIMQVLPDGIWSSWWVGMTLLVPSTALLLKLVTRPQPENKPAHQTFVARTASRSSQFVFEPEHAQVPSPRALMTPGSPWGGADADTPPPIAPDTHEGVPKLTQTQLGRLRMDRAPARVPAMAQAAATAPLARTTALGLHATPAPPPLAVEMPLLPFADDPLHTPRAALAAEDRSIWGHDSGDEHLSVDLGHFPLSQDGSARHDEDASIDIWQVSALHGPLTDEHDAVHSHIEDYSAYVLRSQDIGRPMLEDEDDANPLSRVIGDLAASSNTLYRVREQPSPRAHYEEVDQVIAYFKDQPAEADPQDQGNLKARLKKLKNLTQELRHGPEEEPAARSPLASYAQRAQHRRTLGFSTQEAEAPPPAAPPLTHTLGGPRPNLNAFDVPTRRADHGYQDIARQHQEAPALPPLAIATPPAPATPTTPFKAGIGTMSAQEINALWVEFVDANKACGREPHKLRPEVFLQHLQKNYEAICRQFQCDRVRFTVKVKEGRPALSARPYKAA